MIKKEEFKKTWFINKEWYCFACNNTHADYYTIQRHIKGTSKHKKNSKKMLKEILEMDLI
jgi:hypothetical protein